MACIREKERTMKTKNFGLFSIAALAASAFAVVSPAFAHEGYPYEHGHHFPGHRVVVVRPVFEPRPVVVYRPYPVYYTPAPVVYGPAPIVYAEPAPAYPAPTAAATLGGAIAGAAIGGIASHGRPGGIVAGTVIGAVVGNSLAR
jgi:hypothetical protein